jgi:hypothetical protein
MVPMTKSVHLVGSVPLPSADDVFRATATTLGTYVKRIPDGETGARSNWIASQIPVFTAHESLKQFTAPSGIPRFRLRAGVEARNLTFGELGYARAAVDSYRSFASLKAAGLIGPEVRFQVSIPTPLAPLVLLFDEDLQQAVEPSYRLAVLRELTDIVSQIPPTELAVQWDVAVEFSLLEGVPLMPGDPPPHTVPVSVPEVANSLLPLADAVPAEAELGFHFCYGDINHRHFVEPRTTQVVVDLASAFFPSVERRVDWLHLPVPADRDDAEYFRPLTSLPREDFVDLYLGLVHASDGVEGALRRIAAARDFTDDFGIATECGFGRRDPVTVPALLDLHRSLAAMLW